LLGTRLCGSGGRGRSGLAVGGVAGLEQTADELVAVVEQLLGEGEGLVEQLGCLGGERTGDVGEDRIDGLGHPLDAVDDSLLSDGEGAEHLLLDGLGDIGDRHVANYTKRLLTESTKSSLTIVSGNGRERA